MSLPKKRELRDCLDEIKQASNDITDFTSGLTYEEFTSNRMAMLATLKSVEVIGQACWELREQHSYFLEGSPSLKSMVNQARGMRNRTAHDYKATDYRLVFGVKDAAPELVKEIEAQYKTQFLKKISGDGLAKSSFSEAVKRTEVNPEAKLDKDSGREP